MSKNRRLISGFILKSLLISFSAIFVFACGSAETEVVEVIKEVPVEKEVIKEVEVEKVIIEEKAGETIVKEVIVEKPVTVEVVTSNGVPVISPVE